MTFGTVAILGPGIIGGSLALALAERGLAEKLVIYARRDTAFPEIAKKLPHAHLTTDLLEAVRGADVVVLCVPIETMAELVKTFAGALKPDALVTDVGSVKESVDQELAPLLAGKALWIGSHPMAGSEKAGFESARANLFEGAAVIITPDAGTAPEALQRVASFWESLGGNVVHLKGQLHDHYVAQISHLPHLLAAALVYHSGDDARALSGPGFRDTTRVAGGPPELWAEILLANASAVADNLDHLIGGLSLVQAALRGPDRGAAKTLLLERLQKAHHARSNLPEKRPKNP
jgi:prephenate dehydrogenase